MLDFEDARSRILQLAGALPSERVRIADALGRVLTQEVTAPRALPEADTSAMDGYALSTLDLPQVLPVRLPVSGESRAGVPHGPLEPKTACRIFTGALLPPGTDAVVLQEDVTRDGEFIEFSERPTSGQHVRPEASDLAAGAVALYPGIRLGAFHLGVLASMDLTEVAVTRKAKVSIVCTGDELRAPGSPHRLGTIPESNGTALAGMVTAAGGQPRVAEFVGDDRERTRRQLERALDEADLVLTVGGISVGDHDVVRDALVAAGATLQFYKVRIKPGKPLVCAQRGKTLVLGLPGNPVSSQLTFGLFGLPLLRKMHGQANVLPTTTWGTLRAPLSQRPGRMVFHRVRVEGDTVLPLPNQASGSIRSLAEANALAIVPADSSGLSAGERVELLQLDQM